MNESTITPDQIQAAIRQLTLEVKAEFGGENCSVSCATYLGHSSWFVHAVAARCCAHGDTYQEALIKFRREYGFKSKAEIAAGLRAQAERLTKEAATLDQS